MDAATEKIMVKIEALLRKTIQNGCTIEESASALAKANELAVRYNIDLSRVQTSEDDHYIQFRYKSCWNNYQSYRKAVMLNSIGTVNFVKVLIDGYDQNYCVMFGRKHNIDLCIYMFEVIVKQIGDIANEQSEIQQANYRRLNGKRMGKYQVDAWYDSFSMGAYNEVSRRLQENRDNLRKAEPESMALVIVQDTKLDDAFKKAFPNTRTGKGHTVKDQQAYWSGKKAGSKVVINPGLES
jgi:hypothetical protein